MTVKVYLFNTIPGTHPSWTLAVFAVSEKDARDYMTVRHYTGAKLVRVQDSGKVHADCGATTTAARQAN